HGGSHYEQLIANGQLLMQLHDWQVEDHHGPIGNPELAHGSVVLLWCELEDFDAAVLQAEHLGAEVVLPRLRNPPEGDGGPNHWEIWLRDPDGYKVVLATPDGSADGTWKPDMS